MVEFLNITVGLHCGRVQFRQKLIKDSTIGLTNVFSRKQARLAFSDEVKHIRISCNDDGLLMEGARAKSFVFAFTQLDIIHYRTIAEIYVSSVDIVCDMEKLEDWSRHFHMVTPESLSDDSVNIIRSFMVVTRDLACYLFIVTEKLANVETSIRKILQSLYKFRNIPRNQLSNIAGIQNLDLGLLCPFNNQGEWGAEVSICLSSSNFTKAHNGFSGFQLELRSNSTWSNYLSHYYIVPKLFSEAVWTYTHVNGSILLFGHKKSDLPSRRDAEIFELDSMLWESSAAPQALFLKLFQQILTDHYKDSLASSVMFWGNEGEAPTKWLNLVSQTLRVTSLVVSSVNSSEFKPVILLSSHRSVSLVVAALAQLCLSTKSRASVNSVNRLIQKYFVALGFAFRDKNEPNYLFLLFLDCFYQLTCQNPMEFGIAAPYLKAIATAFLSDFFYEFSFSSPSSRIDACRRDKGHYRWFFPINKHFHVSDLRNFENPLYQRDEMAPISVKVDPLILKKPIAYYPFNLDEKNSNNVGAIYSRSHSESNLADRDEQLGHSSNTIAQNNESFVSRMSRAASSLAPKSIFRQRSSHTLVIYKPLILRKAALNQPLLSPLKYFANDKDTFVLVPRFHLPCLRFWSDFFLSHEYDFEEFEQYGRKP